jgi:putative transposase
METVSEGGYQIRNQSAPHFITFSVVEWVDVFSRSQYCDVIIESLRYCQQHKGLRLFAWCIMSNHLHLVLRSLNNDISGLLRDFKKFTSKQLIEKISGNPGESRQQWMLAIFRSQGESNSRNHSYQFWRQENRPQELYSNKFTFQKLNYLHMNPVTAGLVDKPEHYRWSSARDYQHRVKCGLLDVSFI